MAKPTVLLIGCGEIGTRLLQSLLTMGIDADIECVDPAESGLELAQKRAAEVSDAQSENCNVTYRSSLLPAYADLDLAIIATTSKPRHAIFKDLMQRAAPQAILLEKFLFPDTAAYADVQETLLKTGTKAFVHAPRTAWPGYKNLQARLKGQAPVTMRVTGANWAMASNAVHFMPVFEQLAGAAITRWDASGLDPDPVNNKRDGYLEVTGHLVAETETGSRLEMTCDRGGAPSVTVDVVCGDMHFTIQEGKRVMQSVGGQGGEIEESVFDILFASQMQGPLCALLENRACDLPTYTQMVPLHLALIPIFNTVFFGADKVDQACPVT